MNLRQERLLSRRSQLGRERFKCWNAWCSWHRQRHERGRYRCVALSLFTDPAVHHVRVQAMRQGHTTDAGPRLGTQGKYLCLELLAVFTPAWAVLIQRLFHRLHDPPSWGRCPLHAGSSRWDRRALTVKDAMAMAWCVNQRPIVSRCQRPNFSSCSNVSASAVKPMPPGKLPAAMSSTTSKCSITPNVVIPVLTACRLPSLSGVTS